MGEIIPEHNYLAQVLPHLKKWRAERELWKWILKGKYNINPVIEI